MGSNQAHDWGAIEIDEHTTTNTTNAANTTAGCGGGGDGDDGSGSLETVNRLALLQMRRAGI